MALPTTPADLDYDLPPAVIAQSPRPQRDQARLLVDGADGISHRRVSDLPELLGPGDVVVVNDTRVLPARLRMRRATGGAVEVLLLHPRDDGDWEALVRPSRRLRPGEEVAPEAGPVLASVEIRDDLGEGAAGGPGPHRWASSAGGARRDRRRSAASYITTGIDDPERYQTVYARRPASAAAPTAGLHFTEKLLGRVRAAGAEVVAVELTVGLDTFRPITAARLDDHDMHTEQYCVPAQAQQALDRAGRVVAVGTTVVRCLEAWAATGEASGRTGLFIRRPYEWRVVDALMTNFHMPRSTLLCLLDAFIGPRWRTLYTAALEHGYRFLSFGDAMFAPAPSLPTPLQEHRDAGRLPDREHRGRRPHRDGHNRAGQLRHAVLHAGGHPRAVKHLDSSDLEALGVEVVLANTYHLMLRPGSETVARLGGIHGFARWGGHVLTDSGGYQIYSLAPDVDDDGARLRIGLRRLAVPAHARGCGERAGADRRRHNHGARRLPLRGGGSPSPSGGGAPHCHLGPLRPRRVSGPSGRGAAPVPVRHRAGRRRHRAAARVPPSAPSTSDSTGTRWEGCRWARSAPQMLAALEACTAALPVDSPRYFMGLGDPVGIVEAVARGIDMFDCVLPTRLGRHGTVLSDAGRYNLAAARHAGSDEPLDPSFVDSPAARWSRGYLRHLLVTREPTAARLVTLHNLAWLLRLMDQVRAAVRSGTFEEMRAGVGRIWA